MADVKARLILDSSGFTQGIDKAKASLNKFSTGQLGAIKGQLAAAFTVGAIASFTSHVINVGSKISDLAVSTGIGAEELQKFGIAAKINGSSMEEVASAIQKMSIKVQEAVDKVGNARTAFENLGVTFDDLKTLPLSDIFLKIATSIKNSNDPLSKSTDLNETLGKGWKTLIPLMSEGEEGIKKIGNEAKATGSIISNEMITALDKMGDQLDLLKIKTTSSLAPIVTTMAKGAGFALDLVKTIGGLYGAISMLDKSEGLRVLKDFADGGKISKKQEEPLKIARVKSAEQVNAEKEKAAIEEKRMAAFQEQVFKAQRDSYFESLDLENKLKRIQQEINVEHEREITDAEEKLKSYLKIFDLKKDELKLQKEIDDENLRNTEAFGKNIAENIEFNQRIADIKSGKGISVSGIISDSLARIGGFVGGANDNQGRMLEKITQIADQIKEANKTLEKINANRAFGEEIPDAVAQ